MVPCSGTATAESSRRVPRPAQLRQASLQVAPFRERLLQREGELVCLFRLAGSAQPSKELGSGRVKEMKPIEPSVVAQIVD
jgi:hypothetical protein